jgi:hypothetical protein
MPDPYGDVSIFPSDGITDGKAVGETVGKS